MGWLVVTVAVMEPVTWSLRLMRVELCMQQSVHTLTGSTIYYKWIRNERLFCIPPDIEKDSTPRAPGFPGGAFVGRNEH